MFRQSRFQAHAVGVALAALVAFFALSGAPVQADAGPDAAAQAEVASGLRAELMTAGQGTYLAHLRAQPDLSAAYAIDDWRARGRYVFDRLRQDSHASQADLLRLLERERSGGRVRAYRPFFIVNAVLITSDVAVLDVLAARSDVARLEPAATLSVPPLEPGTTSLAWGVAQIGADAIWNVYGSRGEGVVVAGIDTGVDAAHPALAGQYRGTDSGSHDFNWYDPHGATAPFDNVNHGTHTMGTMVGDDGAGNAIGVAPGARWIAAKGCATSSCSTEDLLAAASWVLAPCPIGAEPGDASCDPDRRPHLVNNSWGGAGGDAWFQGAVDAWRAAGIVPIFSAGNSGPFPSTHGSPGDYCNVISAGATDSGDVIASFSGRGPGAFPGCGEKPDLSAPGVAIVSSVPGGGFAAMNGTSMSAPHVAGCSALLLSLDPDLTYDGLRALMVDNAVDLGAPGYDGAYGHGRLDCYAAAQNVAPDFRMPAAMPALEACRADDVQFAMAVYATGGFADPVSFSLAGTPPGSAAGFAPNPLVPAGTVTLTLANLASSPPATYALTATGQSGDLAHSTALTLHLAAAAPSAAIAITPQDGTTNIPTSPSFAWAPSATATAYDFQLAGDPAFSDLLFSGSATTQAITPTLALDTDTVYFWRVRGRNGCGAGPWSATAAFQTTLTPPATDVIGNGGFEAGPGAGWTTASTNNLDVLVNDPAGARSGAWHVRLGGINSETGQVWQTVQIPASAIWASLTFWYAIDSDDACGWDFGYLKLNGLTAQRYDLCNQSDTGGYVQASFDLTSYAGSNVEVRFRANTDIMVPSTFLIDDVALRYGETTEPAPSDYSDLPSSYGVAWHAGEGMLRLGGDWSADGLFENCQDDQDGDDGVWGFGAHWLPGETVELFVNVNGPGYLAGWFDWDQNGQFDDAPGFGVQHLPGTGDHTVTVTIPPDALVNTPGNSTLVARFRLYAGDPGVLAFAESAAAGEGEVEDYTWNGDPTAVRLEAAGTISPVAPPNAILTFATGLLLLSALAWRQHLLRSTARRTNRS